MNARDKAILTGLYLSKFNDKALVELGFKSYVEAFNVLGLSLGSKASSIKNYRDEFDPLFPNNRQGWHKRPIREYCKQFYNEYQNVNFSNFSDLIKTFYISNYEVEKFLKKALNKDYSESVAKRLLTGKAAEEYFKLKYSSIEIFNNYNLIDTTNMACGFDYKLTNESNYFCIEVKGLSEKSGSILLTEKEHNTAIQIPLNYCLFIVKNFKECPTHEIIFNPLNSRLDFKMSKREVVQINYHAFI